MNRKSLSPVNCFFTPLEKATDEVDGENKEADDGSMSPSAHIVSPVRNKFSNGVRGRSSLTGFTLTIAACLFSFLLSFAEAEAPTYQSAGKRDPFIPYVTNDGQLINVSSEEKEFTLNLEGIIYEKDGQSLVIINGEILKQNDTIGDVKIVEIRKDSIVYMRNGELFVAKREE